MAKPCNCINNFNEKLAPEQELETSLVFSRSGNSMSLQTFTSLMRKDTGNRENRRSKPRLAGHTFCPFCGIHQGAELVRIWSDEHGAYWRPNGCGYTVRANAAGIYTRADAEARTAHCGPEKRIQLEPVTAIQISERVEGQANG